MLGAYLDQAEGEGRDRLTAAEKAALAVSGVGARIDLVVPARVRDLAASAMVAFLGAFGLIAGVLLEWAPGNPGTTVDSFEPRAFGPFVSPFIIVCALALVSCALALVGPERVYRLVLVATVVAGLASGMSGSPLRAWGWSAQYAETGLLIALMALIALSAARPRLAWRVVAASGVWACALLIPLLSDVGFTNFIRQYRDGSLTSAVMLFMGPIWSTPLIGGTMPVFTLLIAFVLAGALALALVGRRAPAAAAVLATVPWAAQLSATWLVGLVAAPVVVTLGSSAEEAAAQRAVERAETGIDLLILVLLYVATCSGVRYFRRRPAARIDDSATPVGG